MNDAWGDRRFTFVSCCTLFVIPFWSILVYQGCSVLFLSDWHQWLRRKSSLRFPWKLHENEKRIPRIVENSLPPQGWHKLSQAAKFQEEKVLPIRPKVVVVSNFIVGKKGNPKEALDNCKQNDSHKFKQRHMLAHTLIVQLVSKRDDGWKRKGCVKVDAKGKVSRMNDQWDCENELWVRRGQLIQSRDRMKDGL